MKVINQLSLMFLSSMLAMGAYAQNFTIKGTIPGVKNGTRVSLRSQEEDRHIEAECLTQGSSFTLTGKIDGTLLVQLQIMDKPANSPRKEGEYERDRGGNLMLEAANYTVSAACYDSIPFNYDLYDVPMVREKNLKIVGGRAQQQYQEWADATYAARLKAECLDKQFRNAKYGKDEGPDTVEMKRLQPLSDEAEDALVQLNEAFVASHPDYAISLFLQEKQLEKPFAYSAQEYDQMISAFAGNYDKTRYAEFVKTVAEMKKYIKGDHYKDLTLESVDGKPVNLKDIVVPNKYNFIDFWASWCGPCRAAIPSVKKLHQKMGDKLNIVSVSVDKKRKDWEVAMNYEKMPWSQFVVPQESMKALKDGYFIKYVPSLVVIDPDGKIQFFTSDPQKAHLYLEEHIK